MRNAIKFFFIDGSSDLKKSFPIRAKVKITDLPGLGDYRSWNIHLHIIMMLSIKYNSTYKVYS